MKTLNTLLPIDPHIDGFLAAYTPEISATARDCHHTLQGLFPQGYELVYKNYNALVFAFASTDRALGRNPVHIRLSAVRALIAQARAPFENALAAAVPLQMLVKSVSAMQRPRRPP